MKKINCTYSNSKAPTVQIKEIQRAVNILRNQLEHQQELILKPMVMYWYECINTRKAVINTSGLTV